MPPNTIDIPVGPDPDMVINESKPEFISNGPAPVLEGKQNYGLQVFQSSMNLLAHILIGATVGLLIMFSFRNGLPLGATSLHIVLCVIGYQLLMAQAILSLTPHNGWSSRLTLRDRKVAHWVLQVLGSGLAIAGSFIKILDKSVHWNTLHGQFALVALVCTVASFFNGVTSLYAYELRRFLPGNLSKITHICFGVVAFAGANISLCYGMEKNFFRAWATDPMTYTLMAFVAVFTFIIIVNPLIIFFNKSKSVLKTN